MSTGGLGAPVAMAIGGAASGAIISGYDAYRSGQGGWELVGSIAKGAGTGAISGLIGGQLMGAGASLATNVTQNIGNQAVRQVAQIGVESAVETAIDTGIDLATGNKITGQTVALNFAFTTFTNGGGSVSPKKAPKADVVTTKPTGGRLPMTVENLQMFAKKSETTTSFLPDQIYKKRLPSQVSPGVQYLHKYDVNGDIVQTKFYDSYGREKGWVDYTLMDNQGTLILIHIKEFIISILLKKGIKLIIGWKNRFLSGWRNSYEKYKVSN